MTVKNFRESNFHAGSRRFSDYRMSPLKGETRLG